MGFIRQPTVFWSLSSTNMYPSWIKTRAGLLRAHRTAVSWTGESLNHLTRPHATRCKPANVQTFLFPLISAHQLAGVSTQKAQCIFFNAQVDLCSSKYVRVMNKCLCLHHKVKILGVFGILPFASELLNVLSSSWSLIFTSIILRLHWYANRILSPDLSNMGRWRLIQSACPYMVHGKIQSTSDCITS